MYVLEVVVHRGHGALWGIEFEAKSGIGLTALSTPHRETSILNIALSVSANMLALKRFTALKEMPWHNELIYKNLVSNPQKNYTVL